MPATLGSAWRAAWAGGLATWFALDWLAFHERGPLSVGWAAVAAGAAFYLARLPWIRLVLEPQRLIAHTIFGRRRIDRGDVRSVEGPAPLSDDDPVTLTLEGGGSFRVPTLTGPDARRFGGLLRSWIVGEPSVPVLANAAPSTPRPSRTALASGLVIAGSLLVLLAGLGASHASRLMQAADVYEADITKVDTGGGCTVAVYEPEAWTADVECHSGDVGDNMTVWVDQNKNLFAEQTGILVEPLHLPAAALWSGAFLVVLGLRLGRHPGT